MKLGSRTWWIDQGRILSPRIHEQPVAQQRWPRPCELLPTSGRLLAGPGCTAPSPGYSLCLCVCVISRRPHFTVLLPIFQFWRSFVIHLYLSSMVLRVTFVGQTGSFFSFPCRVVLHFWMYQNLLYVHNVIDTEFWYNLNQAALKIYVRTLALISRFSFSSV